MPAAERVYRNSSDGEIADTGHSGHTAAIHCHVTPMGGAELA